VDDDDVMLIAAGGKVLGCPVDGISSMGRATQGVRVMRLDEDEKLVSIARLAEEDIVDTEGEAVIAADATDAPAEAAADENTDEIDTSDAETDAPEADEDE